MLPAANRAITYRESRGLLASMTTSRNAQFMANKTKPRNSNQLGSPVSHLRSTPIGDFAFISDGEVSALLSPAGSVEWMSVPRFDSPSVFGSILGRQAGDFRVAPVDVAVPADVRYLPGTMIVETSWGTPTGWIIVRDCLLIGPWHHEFGPLENLSTHPQRLRSRAHSAAHHPLCLG